MSGTARSRWVRAGYRAQRAPALGLWLTLLACALAGCATRAPAPWPIEREAALGSGAFPAAEAVILLREIRIRVFSTDEHGLDFETELRQRSQVLAPAGRSQGRIAIPLGFGDRLVEIRGRSYAAGCDPGTDCGELAADPISVASLPLSLEASTFYSDSRIAILDVPGVDVGRIVEIAYRVRSQGPFGIGSLALDDVAFPIRTSRVVIEAPSEIPLRWQFSRIGRFERFDPELSESGGLRRHAWELVDVEPIREEVLALPRHQLAPTLTIAEAGSSWESIGRFYRELSEGRESVEGVALPPRSADERRSLYEFVRDRVRYVAIEQGLGAVQPHSAREVYAARFGDCKDMATLLAALYRARGIRAWPALIGTRDHRLFSRELASLGAIDHVIVAIESEGGGFHFVDPTAKHQPYEYLPWLDQGRTVVIVRESDVVLAETPVESAERNLESISWRVSGERIELSVELHGEGATLWRALAGGRADPAQIREWIRAHYLGGLADARIEETRIESAASADAGAVQLRARLTPSKLGHAIGDTLVVPLSRFLSYGAELRVPSDRVSPVALGYSRRIVETLAFELGSGVPALTTARRSQLQNAVGSYRMQVTATGTQLEIRRELATLLDEVSAELLAEARALIEEQTRDSREALVVSAPAPSARESR
jgi:hypothetical protein